MMNEPTRLTDRQVARIKALADLGMSQKGLAAIVGVSVRSIARLRCGTTYRGIQPDPAVRSLIAELLKP